MTWTSFHDGDFRRNAMAQVEPHDQHPSHLHLLAQPGPLSAFAAIDAIIVPTARQTATLRESLQLARSLDCPLVALCSRQADATQARALAREIGAEVIAVDVPRELPLPHLLTTDIQDRFSYPRKSDTPLKRNVGLALSRMVGWRRVLFLDDDVHKVQVKDVAAAAALLGRHQAVGLQNVGFHDNSVVCHANRDTGGDQDTFVGAGALLIRPSDNTSFFPNIYNEDWFFLLECDRLIDVTVSGTCHQLRYDPYETPDRARQEEFGDCLAEGLYALLDTGESISAADLAFWGEFLDRRATLIDKILRRVSTSAGRLQHWNPLVASLKAAHDSLDKISPELCVEYLTEWRTDQERWREYLTSLPSGLRPTEALARWNLTS